MGKLINLEHLKLMWAEIKNKLNGKVDKVSGKGLSTNDFNETYKTRLDGYITPSSDNKPLYAMKKDVDLNTLTAPGIYCVNTSVNKPPQFSYGYMSLIVTNSTSFSGNYVQQLAISETKADNNIYIRKKDGGTWSAWSVVGGNSFKYATGTIMAERTNRQYSSCNAEAFYNDVFCIVNLLDNGTETTYDGYRKGTSTLFQAGKAPAPKREIKSLITATSSSTSYAVLYDSGSIFVPTNMVNGISFIYPVI